MTTRSAPDNTGICQRARPEILEMSGYVSARPCSCPKRKQSF